MVPRSFVVAWSVSASYRVHLVRRCFGRWLVSE